MIERINETVYSSPYSERLDNYLAEKFPYLSRSSWKNEIKNGNIAVNGIFPKSPSLMLKKNDTVRFYSINRSEPPVDARHRILYDDDFFLAAEKSGDIPVHPAGSYFNNTLLTILEHEFERKLFPVHRIDRETSGIVLFAKSSVLSSALQTALAQGRKTYTALVKGCPPEFFENNLAIGPAESAVRKKRKAFKNAEETAFTSFRRICSFGNYSLIKAFPRTGRLHQIRVHLENCGFPIIGDKIYGGDETLFIEFISTGMTETLEKKLLMKRCALHASKLEICHPIENRMITIASPLPEDFIDFIRTIRNG